MPVFALDEELIFPPVHLAEPDGLLAIGGDLSSERLLLAYRHGIFPWYSEEDILWWCPDPRFILFPDELKVNSATQTLLNENFFDFTVDTAFREVVQQCKKIKRADQQGTWITDEVEHAYGKMHDLGYAHSAEVWKAGELVGGLYGIKLGKVFFGESMFSKVSNASRYAFTKYVRVLKSEGIELIDCQVYTKYLESMGAKMIERNEFISLLESLVHF
jgi:leucyl/phenylalanyl-tRNA--protein transferase